MSEHPAFTVQVHWTGTHTGTPESEPGYTKWHEILVANRAPLLASAPVVYGGDALGYNPEELMLASLSSCHLLTFLAVAARAKVHVVAYRAAGHGQLDMKEGKIRFVGATLTPHVTVQSQAALDRLAALHQKAHANCFMANSVNFPVLVEATGEVAR
jgi:organic hydroperoxide reductase OsmC/OhrA